MADFKAGDVVQLASGGPKMTIRWIEDSEAYCEWFAATENKGAKFALAQLVQVQPKKPLSADDMRRIARLA